MPRLSTILGPDGERVDLDHLFGEPQAAPAEVGPRSPLSMSQAEGMNPVRLAQIHRAAANGTPRQYLELAEDIEEREPQYLTVLGTRRRQVSQLPITVEAASDDAEHQGHAAFLREFLAEGMLDLALFDMLDAISKGFSVTEITWETLPDRIAPKAFEHRPARWFTFDRNDGETLLLDGVSREALAPHKFITHRHKAKSGITARGGLARAVSWTWMYKAFTGRDWALFVQNYGQPMRLGTFSTMATDADKAALWRAVSSIAGDCAAIVPAGMDIRFVEAKAGNNAVELYLKRVEYLDRMISKIVLGQTSTTDAISGGHAVAQEHRLVQEDIERADAKLLSATLTKQLGETMIAFNFGPQKKYPKVMIGRPDELSIEKFIDGVEKMVKAGLTVRAEEVRSRLGVTKPKPDDEILGKTLAVASPAAIEPDKPAHQMPSQKADKTDPATRAALGLPALHHLTSLHASAPAPEQIDRIMASIAEDTAAALSGLTEELRHVMEQATSLPDLAQRLSRLELPPEQMADALARGMALAHMAGAAGLLQELDERPAGRRSAD